MTKEQVNNLILKGLPADGVNPELVETHISWVILCERFAYKIKKPIQYSFLDFSTLAKRKYYCEREIELNKRLTHDIYIDVLPVVETFGNFFINNTAGEAVDYVVRMRKVDRNKQMDVLLQNNKVTVGDINNLAEKIARFHRSSAIIYEKDISHLQKDFDDLEREKDYLKAHLDSEAAKIITHAVVRSNAFIATHKRLLADRVKAGFFRDCHGDLHSRNIFLLPEPQPFDCIEFNDDFRKIDVLNEAAFLCMDLDAFNRSDLSALFFNSYKQLLPAVRTEEDNLLFVYYKSYRANIRAKVNSLRARSASNDREKKTSLKETEKYLHLMDRYLKSLQ